ncbi:unnamed protein product [Pleuronectes platessa]|uniref:Uncharacterized protein n=1 Tax=Pleuronectes platessa TaxID=8262 RepID=A0A9N7Y6T9_PLEPL|nr:unnamed protein product [Pleuronectes platessa]
MDNKSKNARVALRSIGKKLKSLEVEAAKCAKLTDLFGAGFTSPAAAGAPGDERGGLDNDERVEADMPEELFPLCPCSRTCSLSASTLCLHCTMSVESPLVWLTT